MNNFEFNPLMYKTVGRNIKKYRIENNMTIFELSRYSNIDKNYLNDFENGIDDMDISIYDLYKISIILNVSINKFFIE